MGPVPDVLPYIAFGQGSALLSEGWPYLANVTQLCDKNYHYLTECNNFPLYAWTQKQKHICSEDLEFRAVPLLKCWISAFLSSSFLYLPRPYTRALLAIQPLKPITKTWLWIPYEREPCFNAWHYQGSLLLMCNVGHTSVARQPRKFASCLP